MSANKILTANDLPAFTIENGSSGSHIFVICDHASRNIPLKLKKLGLSDADLSKHIAIDIGAKQAAQYIAKKFNTPALYANYSRLVIDLNRGLNHEFLIPEISDHIEIPENKNLSKADRQNRIDEIFTPYHNAISDKIEDLISKDIQPILLLIHSFTPEMDGKKRPWDMSILWDKKCDLSKKTIDNLRTQNPELTIGDNQPYDPTLLMGDDSYNHTAVKHKVKSILVEFRQDLIDTDEKSEYWAEKFCQAIKDVVQ